MKVIEVDADNRIVRVQEGIPDRWVAEDGVLISDAGHRVFPAGQRWYRAPQGVAEGDTYDPATGTVTAKPLPALPDYKATALATIRQQAQDHILASWPDWLQRNVNRGYYDLTVGDQMDADITATIAESNRVEDLIDAAPDHESVDAARSSVNWPVFPVAPSA